MNEQLIKGAVSIFGVNEEELKELSKSKDLYSAISELSGIDRQTIKLWMHGLAYGVGKEVFLR